MAKAELQAEQAHYDVDLSNARDAEPRGDFLDAITHAMRAWAHVEGMMKYEARWENVEFRSVPCVDLVLRLAPFTLHAEALERMAELFKQQKAIDRMASDDLAARLAAARELLKRTHALWTLVEHLPGVLQSELRTRLGGHQDEWRDLSERFTAMGLLVERKRRAIQANRNFTEHKARQLRAPTTPTPPSRHLR